MKHIPLSKMTKKQLLDHIKTLERDITYLEENSYSDDQMDERFNEGYQQGQCDNRPELSERELERYPNVIRFPDVEIKTNWGW